MFNSSHEFNQPLDKWDTSNVVHMESVFAYSEAFNQNISMWDIGLVDNMEEMFYHAHKFNQPIYGWDVSRVKSIYHIFEGAESFKQDISDWKFNPNFVEPKINGMKFDEHNDICQFTKKKLLNAITIIINNTNDKDKYYANIYVKQFKETQPYLFKQILSNNIEICNFNKDL
jgi:surface protein